MDVKLDRVGQDRSFGLNEGERRFCAAVLGFNLVLALGILGLKVVTGMDLKVLMQDVIVVANLPPYTGAYQFVSILFYAAGAAIALFAVAVRPDDARWSLLAVGGGYAAFACLDDLFTLHENGLFIGLPERGVMAIHAALLVWVLVRARQLGARTPWPVLMAGVGGMALAFLIDAPGFHFPGEGTIEEVLETMGAALLAAYLILTSYRMVAPGPAVGATRP